MNMKILNTMAWDSGILSVLVLTKSDLCSGVDEKVAQVKSSAIGMDVIATSCFNIEDMDKMRVQPIGNS